MKKSIILAITAAFIIVAAVGLTLTPPSQPGGEETQTTTSTTTTTTTTTGPSIYEQRYLETAKKADMRETKGSLEITIVRYGLFTYIPPEDPGREATGLRIDLIVRNTEYPEEKGFLIFETTLTDNLGRWYNLTYSAIDVEAVQPARPATGYIVFESPEEDASELRLTIPDGFDDYFDKIIYEFTLKLK